MDAYDIAGKVQKYWCALYPKHSGELPKSKNKIRVVVKTENGYRDVVGVYIKDDVIELELNEE